MIADCDHDRVTAFRVTDRNGERRPLAHSRRLTNVRFWAGLWRGDCRPSRFLHWLVRWRVKEAPRPTSKCLRTRVPRHSTRFTLPEAAGAGVQGIDDQELWAGKIERLLQPLSEDVVPLGQSR